MVLSEARKRANKKWDSTNKERKNYITKRSVCRNFIKKLATLEDLKEIEELTKQRKKDLKNC